MLIGSDRREGWTLDQAFRETQDPDLLRSFSEAEAAWKAAGAPSVFWWYSTYLNGDEAVRANAMMYHRRQLLDEKNSAARRLQADFRRHLRSGRLIGFGRRDSPMAEMRAIPTTAWDALVIKDYQRSILREATPAKTQVFEVRIYPTIEAPNAVDCLADMPIAAALREFVFGDPQVAALCKRAKADQGEPLEIGFERRLFEAVWPIDCGKAACWEQQLSAIEASRKTNASAHIGNLVLGRRFAALISYLSSGQLVAEGTYQSGQSGIVPKDLWSHVRMHIDVNSGDLFDHVDEGSGRDSSMFAGLTLRKPAMALFHVEPTTHDLLLGRTTEPHNCEQKNLAEAKSSAGTRSGAVRRQTAQHASIAAAVADLWPSGVPAALPVKTRDKTIIDWQRNKGLAVSSSKTISRFMAKTK